MLMTSQCIKHINSTVPYAIQSGKELTRNFFSDAFKEISEALTESLFLAMVCGKQNASIIVIPFSIKNFFPLPYSLH
jgi:hemoglobin-like flavoprotein